MEQHTFEPATRGTNAASGRIDVHTHYLSAEWQAALAPMASAAPIYQGFVSWAVRPALEMMDRQGIATAILSMVLPSAIFAQADDVAAARRLARSANENSRSSNPHASRPIRCLRQPAAA